MKRRQRGARGAVDEIGAVDRIAVTGLSGDAGAWKSVRHGDRTLGDRAYRAIHDAILTGLVQPGSRLGLERLSELLEMSPTPIREALYRLEAVGLVENVPHHGAHIVELSREDLRDLYEARLALEPLAAHHASEIAGEGASAAPRQYLARLIEAEARGDSMEAWNAHTDLHLSLYAASGSRWLTTTIRILWESSQRYRIGPDWVSDDLSQRNAEHELLVATYERGDADAVFDLVRRHLIRTANVIAQGMTGKGLFSDGPLDGGGPQKPASAYATGGGAGKTRGSGRGAEQRGSGNSRPSGQGRFTR